MTPFDADGEIAPRRLAPIIDRALQAGVHIPVVNGNTGDCHALTTDEACAMLSPQRHWQRPSPRKKYWLLPVFLAWRCSTRLS
jgi:hypothetical protein